MSDTTGGLEFDVLGFTVRFKPDSPDEQISPAEVVEYVHREASDIRNSNPNLDQGQLATLVALKLAADNMKINKEYRDNINQLQTKAQDALGLLDNISV